MKRMKVIGLVSLMIIATLTAAVFAQQQRQQRAGAGQREARQQVIQRTIDRVKEQLKLTEAEEAAVMPVVESLVRLRYTGMPNLQRLRRLQRDQSASDESITTALKKFRKDLAETRIKVVEAEKKLMGMPEITPGRELILTIAGVLDNGQGMPRWTNTSGRQREGGRSRQTGN